MKTYFIGREEVHAYLRDLLERLDPLPTIWCPVTESGISLAHEMSTIMEESTRLSVDVCPITVSGSVVSIPDGDVLRGKDVLILDSAVHSGRMMSHCCREILKHSPNSLITYALAVKRCSAFFPTLWGVMTDEGDRPYFLLTSIPNNRLNAGADRKQPAVHIRLLTKDHTRGPPIVAGLGSIDRTTWSDRFFQMQTVPGTSTYVLERGALPVGFLTVCSGDDELTIAEIVVDEASRGLGYGPILMRFAETLARQSDCQTIRLNAIVDRVGWYKEHGLSESSRPILELDNESYQPMERSVLYHKGRHTDGSTVPLPVDGPKQEPAASETN